MRNAVIVCGGRYYNDRVNIYDSLDKINSETPITKIVQGYASGADQIADAWARSRGITSTGKKYKVTKEDWDQFGRGAGHIRNKSMRDKEKPNRVIAFPGGPGTKNMVTLAKEKEIPVTRVDKKGKFHES